MALNVLIADDSRLARDIIRATVESAGHRVVGEAATGSEAVDLYRELRPEVATVDELARVLLIDEAGLEQIAREGPADSPRDDAGSERVAAPGFRAPAPTSSDGASPNAGAMAFPICAPCGEAPLSLPDAPPCSTAVRCADGGPSAPTVLLVDDEEELLEDVSRLLVENGFAVGTVPNGRDALGAIASRVPDLVIAAAVVPGMDGLELTRTLRRRPETASLPVIVVSAKGELEDRLEAYEAGSDDFVVKPFALPELLARARCVLRRTSPGVRWVQEQLSA